MSLKFFHLPLSLHHKCSNFLFYFLSCTLVYQPSSPSIMNFLFLGQSKFAHTSLLLQKTRFPNIEIVSLLCFLDVWDVLPISICPSSWIWPSFWNILQFPQGTLTSPSPSSSQGQCELVHYEIDHIAFQCDKLLPGARALSFYVNINLWGQQLHTYPVCSAIPAECSLPVSTTVYSTYSPFSEQPRESIDGRMNE
jgi:hypothetical protein